MLTPASGLADLITTVTRRRNVRREKVEARMSPEQIAWLDAQTESGVNRSDVVRRLVNQAMRASRLPGRTYDDEPTPPARGPGPAA